MSKNANRCNTCHRERMAKIHAEAWAVVEKNECPHCKSKLRRNPAIAGWWQCEQYGTEGFRADSSKPSCSFQCFTE